MTFCAECGLRHAPVTNVPVRGEANASPRTAPRRTVTVDRAVIVAALDAWQQFVESEEVGDTDDAYDALAEAMAELNAEVRP